MGINKGAVGGTILLGVASAEFNGVEFRGEFWWPLGGESRSVGQSLGSDLGGNISVPAMLSVSFPDRL
jgi:hypothetical protein